MALPPMFSARTRSRVSHLRKTLSTAEPSSAKTAVVIAGEADNRVLLRALLRIHHFQVPGEAEGAASALEVLRVHRPALMVVDVHLAEGNPETLISEARVIVPNLRVILVTSASDPPAFRSNAPYRPDAVLLRPFRVQQFAEAVRLAVPTSEESQNDGGVGEATR